MPHPTKAINKLYNPYQSDLEKNIFLKPHLVINMATSGRIGPSSQEAPGLLVPAEA